MGTLVSKFSKGVTLRRHQALIDIENGAFRTLIIEKFDRQLRLGVIDCPTLVFLDRAVKAGGRLVGIEDRIDTNELSEMGGVIKITVAAEMAKHEYENKSMHVQHGKRPHGRRC